MSNDTIDYKKYENDFIHALLSRNSPKAEEILKELSQKESFANITEKIITPALEKIGRNWQEGTMAISQVYLSGHICNKIIDKLLPDTHFSAGKQPNIAIATLGDYHTLGKKMVSFSLKTAGYEVTDFGFGLLIHEILEKCKANKTDILLISTLMLSSALLIKHLMISLKDINPHIKVIVGGAPFCFDHQLWKELGAHAMGYNATDAIGIVKRFAGEQE